MNHLIDYLLKRIKFIITLTVTLCERKETLQRYLTALKWVYVILCMPVLTFMFGKGSGM